MAKQHFLLYQPKFEQGLQSPVVYKSSCRSENSYFPKSISVVTNVQKQQFLQLSLHSKSKSYLNSGIQSHFSHLSFLSFLSTITLLFPACFLSTLCVSLLPYMLHCGFNSKKVRVWFLCPRFFFACIDCQVPRQTTLNASCRRRVYFHLLPRDGDPRLELEREKRGGGDGHRRHRRRHLSHERASAGIQLRRRLRQNGYTGRVWQGAEHSNSGHEQMKCPGLNTDVGSSKGIYEPGWGLTSHGASLLAREV